MKTEMIKVDNLKCQGCAKTIRRELTWIGEVISVDVDVEQSVVTVDYAGKNRMRKVFVEKLRKLGYPEEGTGNINQKVKSYVSCAIGRIN
ncbi:MAG: heavy-metal-associated domain-containing protein [Bacteroidales bacterium]|jgi:copper chaperone CopZ|nr:heavy-metal-associated domain-containing protein [Bacteroidales bacterium]